jgi:hypothetical protein
MRRIHYWVFSFCLWCSGVVSQPLFGEKPGTFHTSTEWQLKPSLKFDALCLLNTLSGDPYYLKFYRAEYAHFHPLFTPEENAAFVQLKHVIKDEGHGIVSAQLTLYYSTVADQTLPEMINTARDSSAMQASLKKTPYYFDDSWKVYDAARPALEAALRALDRVGFTAYWEMNARPGIERRIAELRPDLTKYNILPVIERYLGFAVPSETITVYILSYSEPHDIRVSGLQFLTHKSYPFGIVLHSAIHESMHPPFDKNNPSVRRAIDLLSGDPLVIDKVEHHDPSFGYNTAVGYIEEDSVQALEQIVSEQFGQGRNPHIYWKYQDGGMHLLATAIYSDYKAAFQRSPKTYSEWFAHAVEDGELRGSNLQATTKHFSLVTFIETTIFVAVLVCIFIGSIFAFLAYKTRRNPVGWFFLGFFLNVFALAVIGVITTRKKFNAVAS